jgi:hypothetical protein
MRQVFADTLYWVASITPGDPWHRPTLQAVKTLVPAHLVTTEAIDLITQLGSNSYRSIKEVSQRSEK